MTEAWTKPFAILNCRKTEPIIARSMRKYLYEICICGGALLLAVALAIPPFLSERQRYPRSVAEGHVLTAAVYAYKEQKGEWPAQLDDLVPQFLPVVPNGWHYLRRPDEPPSLRKRAAHQTDLEYYFPPAEHPAFPPGTSAGWIKDDEGHETYLGD
jgi:hypothetical protein